MIVNANLSSLSAQRMLFENTKAATTAMERLATGSKINKAQDDVAGSAIAGRMTSQVRGLNMAVKNVNDAMAMLSEADSAASDITDMLQRMRELAIQAASDTNSAAERQYLQDEVDSLIQEIDRVATQTQYNGMNLLDGSKSASFQVGANSGQAVGFDFSSMMFSSSAAESNLLLEPTGNSVSMITHVPMSNTYNDSNTWISDSNFDAGTLQSLNVGDKVVFESHPNKVWTVSQDGQQVIGLEAYIHVKGDARDVSGKIYKVAQDPSSQAESNNLVAAARGEAISLHGNSSYPNALQLNADGSVMVVGSYQQAPNETGSVEAYQWNGTDWVQRGLSLTPNSNNISAGGGYGWDVAINSQGDRIAISSTRSNYYHSGYAEIFEWTGSQWSQVGQRLGGGYEQQFGHSISLSDDGNTIAVGATWADNRKGQVLIYDHTGSQWVQRGNSIPGEEDLDYFGYEVSLSGDGNTFVASAKDGNPDYSMGNSEEKGYVKTYSWDGNSWVSEGDALHGNNPIWFGRSVELASTADLKLVYSPFSDAIGELGQSLQGAGQAYVFEKINDNWEMRGEGFTAGLYNAAYYSSRNHHDAAISSDGSRAAIFIKDQAHNGESTVSIFDWNGETWNQAFELKTANLYENDMGAFDLSADGTTVSIVSGEEIITFDLPRPEAEGLASTNLSSDSKFLTLLEEKISQINSQRAEYGAMQNRLQYTISNLMNVSENTVAARSRIEDADFATESAALAKTQVLQQSGAAMLAQANARPQLVLQLIK